MASTHITGGLGNAAPFAGGSTVSSTSSSTPIQQHSMAPGAAPPGTTPEALAAASEETRQDLELKLKELIECLLELSITVYDFQPESNSLVHQKNELISQISDIEAFKDKLDIMVPMEVLSFIEDGKNPDLFTKSFIECVAGENQFTNGKITAMKSFESSLTQNLGSVFPEEMDEYQDILKSIATGSGSGAGASGSEPGTGAAHIKEESTPGETSMASVNTASTLSSASTSLSPPS